MQFDDKFFDEIGLKGASDEQKAQAANNMAEAVQNRVAVKLTAILTEEQLDHLDKLADSEDDEAIQKYLVKVYPEYYLLVQDEIAAIKAELSHDVAAARKVLEETEQ